MSDTPSWLAALETQVEAAAAEVTRLRAENRDLGERLAAAQAAVTAAQAAAPAGAGAAWESERAAIRGRVEALVGHLENLLRED